MITAMYGSVDKDLEVYPNMEAKQQVEPTLANGQYEPDPATSVKKVSIGTEIHACSCALHAKVGIAVWHSIISEATDKASSQLDTCRKPGM